MCGIAGYFGPPIASERLRGALGAMAHRGPDGSGFVREVDTVRGIEMQMAHSRLAIQDLSANGNQPMNSPTGRFCLAFNGEIYNYKEVRSSLASEFEFKSSTDTEVLLHAFDLVGWEVLSMIEGMFALIVWDRRERVATLVRDRFGEKPLYIAEGTRSLLVASEVRAILATGLVTSRLSQDGLASLLYFGSVCHPFTAIRDVRSIGPGERASFDTQDGLLRVTRYWDFPDPRDRNDVGGGAIDAIAGAYSRACRLTTVSDTPIAVLSSGGIDSSCNVIKIAEQRESAVTTFHVRLHDDAASVKDALCAERLSRDLNLPHIETRIGSSDLMGLTDSAFSVMDQPSVDGINTFIVSRAVRNAGLKVAVSGQGADELFLGYPSAPTFGYLGLLRRVPGLQAISGIVGARLGKNCAGVDDYRLKLFSILSDSGVHAEYASQHSVFSNIAVSWLLEKQVRPASAYVLPPQEKSDMADTLVRLEAKNYLHNTLLRDGDQMSMANSVEMRTPFLNHRLVSATVRMHPSLFNIKHRTKKWPLIAAMNGCLPEYIWNKPKRGFLAPFDNIDRKRIALLFDECVGFPFNERIYEGVRGEFLRGQSFFRFFAVGVANRWCSQNSVNTY